MLVLPLFPYTAPPTVAAISPSVQNTRAKPEAKAKVGRVVSLSSRSPAAVEIYEMVKGKSPQTQGETDVNSPAKYMIGMEDTKLVGSSREDVAKEDAAFCALKAKSSQFTMARADDGLEPIVLHVLLVVVVVVHSWLHARSSCLRSAILETDPIS